MCLWSLREGPNQKSWQNRPLLKFNFTPENTLIYSILDIFKAFLAILKFLKNFIKTLTDAPGSEKKIFFLDFLEYFNLTHNPIPSTFQKNDFWKIVGVLLCLHPSFAEIKVIFGIFCHCHPLTVFVYQKNIH